MDKKNYCEDDESAAECSGRVQVTSTSLNLSIRVSNCDRDMFSISMISSR